MPLFDGKNHILECAHGHKWESGDFQHHPVKSQTCPHRSCGGRCVKMTCPDHCSGPMTKKTKLPPEAPSGTKPREPWPDYEPKPPYTCKRVTRDDRHGEKYGTVTEYQALDRDGTVVATFMVASTGLYVTRVMNEYHGEGEHR